METNWFRRQQLMTARNSLRYGPSIMLDAANSDLYNLGIIHFINGFILCIYVKVR